MKSSDVRQAVRLVEMLRALTEQECSSVEICSDNPDPSDMPDCLIRIDGASPEDYKEFRADSVVECLEAAMRDAGKPIPNEAAPVDWAAHYANMRKAVAEVIATAPATSEAKPEFNTALLRLHESAMPDSVVIGGGFDIGREGGITVSAQERQEAIDGLGVRVSGIEGVTARGKRVRHQVMSVWEPSTDRSDADIAFGAVIHTLSCVFGSVFAESNLTVEQDLAIGRVVEIMRGYIERA